MSQEKQEAFTSNNKKMKLSHTTLRVKKLSEHAVLPFRATKFSAGYDLSR
jgi:hypothetical protein